VTPTMCWPSVASRTNADSRYSTRYTWLRNPENWTEKDAATFNDLKNKGLKVGRAWAIKETFMDIWEYTYEQSARKFFANRYWWAKHSRLAPIV